MAINRVIKVNNKALFKKPTKKTIFLLVGCLLIIPLFTITMKGFGIIFTYTGSVPIGFYRIVPNQGPLQRGRYVSFCLPKLIAQMGLTRGYLARGSCADGGEELLKEVIAIPGDQVVVTNSLITVTTSSATYSYQAPSTVTDHDGLPVHRFIHNGTYMAKGVWVYGNGDPHYSWDSRYYGSIPQAALTHRLAPLWQF